MIPQTFLATIAPPDLALAVVKSSITPLLLLDGDLDVVAASLSFCRAFEIDPAAVSHRPLGELGAGEWGVPQLDSLLEATASGFADVDAYEMDLIRKNHETRRLVLNAQKLDYADDNNIRLLLAVSDVTEARRRDKAADDKLRENSILLQELQHRVANSLQIIASVLMQSARTVQSDETRGHLHSAHHRVMSVAAVQQQLAVSTLGEVELRGYLTALCGSIGASMIRDHALVSLEVRADKSVTSGDISVSLGLIVTELVINALKHAFPDGRSGKIIVDYRARGPEWTLSVSDDGIGLPADPDVAKSGLGTTIVRALAKKLEARVCVADTHPGTAVTIVHEQVAIVAQSVSAAPFRFAVGQPVSYAEDGKPEIWKGGYDIVELSDLGSREPQYVIRNSDQSYDRIVEEHELQQDLSARLRMH